MKRTILALLLAALLIPGCFLPEGEVTPSFVYTVNGNSPKYDTINQSAWVANGVITVHVGGSADPIPGAVDDEFGDSLRLDLNQKELGKVKLGLVYKLAGTTSTDQLDGGWIDSNTLVFTPGDGHLGAVKLIYLSRSCFCYSNFSTFAQHWTGFIRFHQISYGQIKATLSLTMDGDITAFWPGDGATNHAKLEVAFDVAPKVQ